MNSAEEREKLANMRAEIEASRVTAGGSEKLKELLDAASSPAGVGEKEMAEMELQEWFGAMLLKFHRHFETQRTWPAKFREDLRGSVNPLGPLPFSPTLGPSPRPEPTS